MGYIKAQQILPQEIIDLIWEYVDGENIYIPKKPNSRAKWGAKTDTKQELKKRNSAIYRDFCTGFSVRALSDKYFLCEKSIQRIVYNERKKTEQAS